MTTDNKLHCCCSQHYYCLPQHHKHLHLLQLQRREGRSPSPRCSQPSWVLCPSHRWIGEADLAGRRLTILQPPDITLASKRHNEPVVTALPLPETTVSCFQAKRFNRKASCAYCHDRIWGLGRQGFKCIQCRLLIHKKCHKLCRVVCDARSVAAMPGRPANSENVTPEQSMLPGPELTNDPVIVEGEDQGGAGSQQKSNMVSLADFDLIKVIGRGSYAKVLMVELKSTKRIYAMKVIKKELVTDDEDIDWVQTEKHVFETASNHPFLVGLHSCFQTASRYLHHHLQFLSSHPRLFFVIEFVRGGDLMFHMQRQRRLPEEHARCNRSFSHCKGYLNILDFHQVLQLRNLPGTELSPRARDYL